MVRFLLRRLMALPLLLILAHFAGFAFAHVTYQFQQSTTIYGSGREGISPVWPEYAAYLRAALGGDFGRMPAGVDESIAASVASAALKSLGLLALAFSASVLLGMALGLSAVRVDPPRSQKWLTVLSTAGLAMPSFYAGTLLVAGVLFLSTSRGDPGTPVALLPVSGFGWDAHLILPVLALSIRPTVQIAQVIAALLAGEIGKRYVIAARSFGYTWRAIRWNKALRNILAPLLITFAGSFRLLVTELVIVEWLFGWPGMGRMLVRTLVPPTMSSVGGFVDHTVFLLYPPLVAALVLALALLFLLADAIATGLARQVDPRMQAAEEVRFDG